MPTIRLGVPSDHPHMRPIEEAADSLFHAAGVELGQTGAGPADDAPYAEGLRAGRVLIAEDDVGEPVGFLYLESLDDHPHIEELAVHPRAQRQGLGAALLRACYALCRDRGAGVLSLSTFSHLPWNAPFYAREGFVVVAPDGYRKSWNDGRLRTPAHEAEVDDVKSVKVPELKKSKCIFFLMYLSSVSRVMGVATIQKP